MLYILYEVDIHWLQLIDHAQFEVWALQPLYFGGPLLFTCLLWLRCNRELYLLDLAILCTCQAYGGRLRILDKLVNNITFYYLWGSS